MPVPARQSIRPYVRGLGVLALATALVAVAVWPTFSLALAVLALLAAALAAGCGEPAARSVEGHVVSIRMEDFRFVPQNISVPAGRLTIRARNAGDLAHNVKVFRGKPFARSNTGGDEIPATPLGGTPTVLPGRTAVGTVGLKPGTYTIACTVGNHDNLGMYGKLVVR
jgi:plastocyanin